MGKLREIKRAFDQLDHDAKITMHALSPSLQYGCIKEAIRSKPRYSVPNSPWCFYRGVASYRNYVTKLANRYHHKHIVSKRHVFERAYLDGEAWAVEKFDKLYRG